jgi:hypothetical protein
VRPVPLFTLREPLDQFEVDLGAVLLRDHAEGVPRLVPQAELFEYRSWPRTCSKP